MADNLTRRGIATTVVEMADQVLTPLVPEMGVLVAAELVRNGIEVTTGSWSDRGHDDRIVLADGRVLAGDIVVAAIGMRPDVRLEEMAGLALGPWGGIAVDEVGRTSAPDIYAVGDAVEKADSVASEPSLIAPTNGTSAAVPACSVNAAFPSGPPPPRARPS